VTAIAPASAPWRRNVFAVTAASFMGYTGFTLVMPFLPLFIGELGSPPSAWSRWGRG
jgi:hypothetical protein